MLVEQLGFSKDEIRTLILQAVQAAWLPSERKAELATDLRTDPDW